MGMDAALVRERHLADDRLVHRERDAGVAGDKDRERIDLLFLDPGLVTIEDFKRHHDLLKRRVACPLAKAVHGHMGTGGPGFQGRHRVGHGKAEVVMAVDRERGNLCKRRDELRHFLRCQQPDRVAEAEPVGPLFNACSKDFAEELLVGPGCIFSGEFDNEPPALSRTPRHP